MKKLISFLLSVILTLSGNPSGVMAAGEMLNFYRVNTYTSGQFTDVSPDDWYNSSVAAAYEMGLMSGESTNYFNAAGHLTVAQTIVMAARLHKIYNTGSSKFESDETDNNWYAPYVSYAQENGIIADVPDLGEAATRAQFVDILSRALPRGDFEQINEISADTIPDVKAGDEYADSIYMFYRAGIVAGSNLRGTFRPQNIVSRAEAAAIITRMTNKSLRQSFSLDYSGPDLTVQEEMDDSFFENAAILGNSLVDGLMVYSNLKSLKYFSGTSVSVVSASMTRSRTLKNGSSGTLVQALCQDPHDKIYIELGINEIGGELDYFINVYSNMLDTIRAAEPDADIYILSILPVTKDKSDSSRVFNMTRINMYNEALHTLAEEKQCYYMDLCSALQGDDGYLPTDWSFDGVHLHAPYYSVWEKCMRTMY